MSTNTDDMTDPLEYATAELRADLLARIKLSHTQSLTRILQSILRTFEAEVAFERNYAERHKT